MNADLYTKHKPSIERESVSSANQLTNKPKALSPKATVLG